MTHPNRYHSLIPTLAVLLAVAACEPDEEEPKSGGGSGRAGASNATAGVAGVAGLGGAGGATGGTSNSGTGGVAGVGGAGGASGGTGGTAGSAASGGTAGDDGPIGEAGAGGSAAATAFQPCPATGPCLVLPIGDSITEGNDIPGGYRMELFSLAHADMHDIAYVGSQQNGPTMVDDVEFPRKHEGHGGWRINQLLDLIPAPAFDTVPHIVLLMVGTNDVLNRDALDQAPTRLGNLLDQMVTAAPNALIVVAKITPMSGSVDEIQNYNDAIPVVVGSKVDAGKHVIIVDQNAGFPLDELVDGVHPTPAGYARMAGVWYTAIAPYLP
jgi:lysophospholipase L1-like esterase